MTVRNLSLYSDHNADALRKAIVYRAAMHGFRIPVWVPTRFHAEYADCAMAHGEGLAAHHARRLIVQSSRRSA